MGFQFGIAGKRSLPAGVALAVTFGLVLLITVHENQRHFAGYKSVPLVPGATVKQTFHQASSVPFSLIVNDDLADNEEGVDLSAEDFEETPLPPEKIRLPGRWSDDNANIAFQHEKF